MTESVEGKTLPSLELTTTDEKCLRIPEDLLGSWTLLYFYPKDDTPGCTKQAQSYRDQLHEFNSLEINVIGISLDDIESHRKFKEKYDLNFPLAYDQDHRLSEALGVYKQHEWKGKKFMGLSRDSFLIDTEGTIRRVWRSVDPKTTVAETLEAAKQLATA